MESGSLKGEAKGCNSGDIVAMCTLEATGKPQCSEVSRNFSREQGTGVSLVGKPEENWPTLRKGCSCCSWPQGKFSGCIWPF